MFGLKLQSELEGSQRAVATDYAHDLQGDPSGDFIATTENETAIRLEFQALLS
jgi:hypothetical protein